MSQDVWICAFSTVFQEMNLLLPAEMSLEIPSNHTHSIGKYSVIPRVCTGV